MCYLYSAFFILVLAYPETFDRNHANDSSYTKKSQRYKIQIWGQLMTAWFVRQLDQLATKIDKINLRFRNKKKLRKMTHQAAAMQIPERRNKTRALFAFAAIAMQARSAGGYENSTQFDTDSGPVGIDNRCTACISNRIEDFEGQLVDSNRHIKGCGGTRT